jgi:hypothetical protein
LPASEGDTESRRRVPLENTTECGPASILLELKVQESSGRGLPTVWQSKFTSNFHGMETILENDRIAAGTETNEMSYKQIILLHDRKGRT